MGKRKSKFGQGLGYTTLPAEMRRKQLQCNYSGRYLYSW